MATSGSTLHGVADAIARQAGLDRPAELLTTKLRDVLGSGPVKDALSGTWLGHPLHPLLTDLPIGFWTSAFTLDVLGGKHSRRAATRSSAWGVLTASPHCSQWRLRLGRHVRARAQGRLVSRRREHHRARFATPPRGWTRRRGRHWRGVALGLGGATAATVGGYLGGHLLQSAGRRCRPHRPPATADGLDAVSPPPRRSTSSPRCVLAGEAPVIVLRHGGRLVALDARCPHRGAPMDEGEVEGDMHRVPVARESSSASPTARLVQGPSMIRSPPYECRIVGDDVEVRSAD